MSTLTLMGIAGAGVLALLLILVAQKASSAQPAAVSAHETDLIAEAEEDEARRSVLERMAVRAEAEAQAAQEGSAMDDSEQMVWEEQEDVYRPTAGDAQALLASLPLNPMPRLDRGRSCILIRQTVYAKILLHLKSDLEVEQGGLLIGSALHDIERNLYLLRIEEALPVSKGVETQISFTYTPESWDALMPQLQQLDASWTILGTYHSHPGMGVFLSRTDLDTQETSFSQDWQIALVIDPIADEVGFFTGKFGKPCTNWHLLQP